VGGDLTEAQRRALDALAPIVGADFYLAGGVAVALRLHHRQSRDLDLFAPTRDPTELEEALAQLPNLQVTSRTTGTLHLAAFGVPVSLLRYRYPLLAAVENAPAIPVQVASAEDLICMKLSAVAGRGARRDFWDLHELLVAGHHSLEHALELYRRKYAQVDRGHLVRALAYFADADAEPMPAELTEAAWAGIKRDFESWVVALS
jgi:hypothetical protein